MNPQTPWRAAVAIGAAAALIVPGGAADAAGSPARVALPAAVDGPPSTVWQAADPTTALQLRVFLSGQDQAGLARAALAAATPGTPAYARYLTPAQYRKQFGATGTQIADVKSWLTGQGMTVTSATAHYVAVNATVAEASTAFAAEFRTYTIEEFPGFDEYEVAPAGTISVPASLGGDIASVTGLTVYTGGGKGDTPAVALTKKATAATTTYPCSQFWGENKVKIPPAYGHSTAPTQVCGYTPQQMRQAYGVTGSSYTGKGSTVAIVLDGASPTMEADADRFFADHGVAGFAPGQYTENLGPGFDCSDWPDGDNPEEALDVETVHIIAPDAKVVFVSAGCTYDDYAWLDAHTRIVDDHLADVVSNSWPGGESGTPPALVKAWELVLQQGAVEGIGMNFSSGDYGDDSDGSDGKADLAFPTSDPWATGVGGTSLAIGRDGKRLAEWGWGDMVTPIGADGYTTPPPGTFNMGSGGGVSTKLAEPAYQKGVVPSSLSGGKRAVPDVSADAGTFWLVGYTAPDYDNPATDGPAGPSDTGSDPGPPVYAERAEGGGTSGSSPLLAALEADAKQATGHALGFVNPALYRLAGTSAFHDIRPVNPADPPISAGSKYCNGDADSEPCLTTLGEDLNLAVRPGYDTVTGIGTPSTSFVTAFRGL